MDGLFELFVWVWWKGYWYGFTMGAIIGAVITGLGGIFLNWLAQRRAQADHDKTIRQSEYIDGIPDKTIAEKTIEQAGKDARDTATPDFTTLQ